MKRKVAIVLAALALIALVYVATAASDKLSVVAEKEAADDRTVSYLDVGTMAEGAATFSTNLPIVVIDTDGQTIMDESRVRASFAVIDDTDDASASGENASDAGASGGSASGETTSSTNALTDALSVNCFADVNIRGHSSSKLKKKSYRITLYKNEDSQKEYDVPLMGMASESDWVLYGPYQDLSLMRNVLMYGVARQCMAWAPSTRYCELWLNGEYQGVYVMVEKIQVSENRLNLADYSLLTGETSFLVSREIPGSNANEYNSYVNSLGLLYQPLSILYPKETEILPSQQEWIEGYLNEFERALYAEYYRDPERGYQSYIDFDSFVTYYVLSEFSINEDTGYHSTYCYRDVSGKLIAGPVWDFNSAFDNYVTGVEGSEGLFLVDNTWFDRMCTDPVFVSAVIEKYRELRTGILSEENLVASLDSYRAELGPAIERNDAIWAHYGADTGLPGDERKYADYEVAFEQLKTCVVERGRWLDENIDDLYLLCVYE